MEYLNLLIDIWRKNKVEFFFWIIILLLAVPFIVVVWIHHYIEVVTAGLTLPTIQIKRLQIGLVDIISIFLIDVLILMLISRFHRLDLLIACRSKGKDEIKHSIKSVTYHLLDSLTVSNLYGNMLISKLTGAHQPKKREDIGESFWFIRHEKDFETHPSLPSSTFPRQQLIDKQIEDFYTIQQCIKKSWNTVAYGDITVLLEKPEYISHNVKIIKKRLQKRKVRRLFIYPYYDGTNMVNFIQNELGSLTLNETNLQALISISPANNLPRTSVDIVQRNITGISPDAARAIRDGIYLIWLVKLHEKFGIDYRIVPRQATSNAAGVDIIGAHLLNSWQDEGSALIDDQVIVRFDDKMQTNGVIYYQFIKAPDYRLVNYKEAFDTVWGSSMPRSYTLEERRSNGVISYSLREFLSIFFNDTTRDVLLDISADKWIEIINSELKEK